MSSGHEPAVDDVGGGVPEEHVCDDAYVFAIANAEAAESAVERFTLGESPIDVLGEILEYVAGHRDKGAELTPLYPERAVAVLHPTRAGSGAVDTFRIAIPDLRSRRQELSAFHYLRLASPEHKNLFKTPPDAEARGLTNTSTLTEFFQPPLASLPDEPAPAPDADADSGKSLKDDPEWGINHCGFPEVWNELDQGFDPGPIGVIDTGFCTPHPVLEGRVREFPPEGTPSDMLHASKVVAIIAARRDLGGMRGCCSARIHLYNVATDRGFSCKAFYMALKAVAEARLPVVNLSMFVRLDPLVERQIEECLELGIIVVAAIGNSGKSELIYPAAYPGVIAVGATNVARSRFDMSTTGTHIWICAPGEKINTLTSREAIGTRGNDGTSFAAPMVSAAAWLALRRQPNMSVAAMRDLLRNSVSDLGLPFDEVGHGQLDMRVLLRRLTEKTRRRT